MKRLFKKLRWRLAEKVLGADIVQEVNLDVAKHQWLKEQLAHGNSVTLEYKITNIEEGRKK